MAINVNEEGVMKPLTIDGVQTSEFTINGIELLFNGILTYTRYDTKYNNMPEFTLPRSPQDYKFFIIIAVPKFPSNGSVSSIGNTITVIDLERFFDGATITKTGGTIGYEHSYYLQCGSFAIILKDNPEHTKLYMALCENSSTVEYYNKIFGVY